MGICGLDASFSGEEPVVIPQQGTIWFHTRRTILWLCDYKFL